MQSSDSSRWRMKSRLRLASVPDLPYFGRLKRAEAYPISLSRINTVDRAYLWNKDIK